MWPGKVAWCSQLMATKDEQTNVSNRSSGHKDLIILFHMSPKIVSHDINSSAVANPIRRPIFKPELYIK